MGWAEFRVTYPSPITNQSAALTDLSSSIASLSSTNSSFGLVRGDELNDVCNEEVAWDKGVKAGS